MEGIFCLPKFMQSEHFSHADPENGDSAYFSLGSGQHRELDAGVFSPAAIGGLAWLDNNADGLLDPTETVRIPLVTVALRGPEGTLAVTTTDAHGMYRFQKVPLGTVSVHIDALPKDLQCSSRQTSHATGKRVNAIDAQSMASRAIPLTSGVALQTIDIGLFRLRGVTAIVFCDRAGNGVFEEWADLVAQGSLVHLDSAQGDPIASLQTDDDGSVRFSKLVPARYALRFDEPVNGAQWSDAIPLSSDVEPENHNASCVDVLGRSPRIWLRGNSNTDVVLFAGYYVPVKVRGCLFNDRDGNARRDPNDEAVADAVAILERASMNDDDLAQPHNVDNDIVDEPKERVHALAFRQVASGVTLDADGCFDFPPQRPGHFRVRFEPKECDGCKYAPQQVHVSRSDDPQPLSVHNGTTDDATSTESGDMDPRSLRLWSGDEAVIEQGAHRQARIRGTIFADRMGTGILTEPVSGVAHAVVRLIRADTKQLVATTRTDLNGRYEFTDFAFGDYFLKFDQPDMYLMGNKPTAAAGLGVPEESKTACADENGRTRVVSAQSGSEHVFSCGMVRAASIGAHLWHDVDADGAQRNVHDEIDAPGIQAVLLKAHDTNFRRRCTLDSRGRCTFDQLAPDDYYVRFERPEADSELSGPHHHGYHFSERPQRIRVLRVMLPPMQHDAVPPSESIMGDALHSSTATAFRQRVAQALGVSDDVITLLRVTDLAQGVRCDFALLVSTNEAADERGVAQVSQLPDVRHVTWHDLTPDVVGERVASVRNDTAESSVVHLGSGEHAAVAGGIFRLASVGGYVFIDADANGRWDSQDESVAPNTPVELRRQSDHKVVSRTHTDDLGRFDFVGVVPSQYYVHFGKCDDCRFSPKLLDAAQ